ncbi:MAG: phage tail assembly chaperone, partial [Brevundimonas sp.]
KITFKHKTRRGLADFQGRAVDVALAAGADGGEALYVDYVHEVIDSWAGVGDAEGKPLPYSREALAQLLEAYPAAGAEIVRRYTWQLSHARAGN